MVVKHPNRPVLTSKITKSSRFSLYKESNFEMTKILFVSCFYFLQSFPAYKACSTHQNTHPILENEMLPDTRIEKKQNKTKDN